MSAGPARISIIANGRQARAEFTQTGLAATRMGKTFKDAAKLVVGSSLLYASARGVSEWIRTGNTYTQQLAKIAALSTKAQLQQVGGIQGVASELEKNRHKYAAYGYDVADAANAVTELVKAGKTLPQSLRAVNATMVLARAGNIDVSDSAELVSNALNSFHLRANQAGRVANELANAANLSSADVSDLAESLKYVSVVAHHAGLSFAQTNAYLAILSNNGLKGSLAGTGLRKVIQSLEAPTNKQVDLLKELGVSAYDSTGKAKPLNRTLADLQKALSGLSTADRKTDLRQLFGLTGLEAGNIILTNLGKNFDHMTAGIDRAGAATKLAKANSAGLVGTLRTLRTELVDDAQIIYREWSPALNHALRPMIPVVRGFGNDVRELKTFLDGIPGPLKAISIEGLAAAIVFPRLAAGATASSKAIADQITYLRVLKAELSDTAVGTDGLSYRQRALSRSVMPGVLSATKQLAGVGGLVALTDGFHRSAGAASTLETALGGAAEGFALTGGPIGALIGGGAAGLIGLTRYMSSTSDAVGNMERAIVSANYQPAIDSLNDLASTLDSITLGYTKATRAAVVNALQAQDANKNGIGDLLEFGGANGLSQKQIVDSFLGKGNARGKLAAAIQSRIDSINAQITQQTNIASHVDVYGPNSGNYGKALDRINQLQKELAGVQALKDAYGGVGDQIAVATTKAKANALATTGYVGMLKGIPKDLVTEIKTKGLDGTLEQVTALSAKYHLLPSQIRALLRAAGVNANGTGQRTGSNYGAGLVAGIRAHERDVEAAANALVAHADAEIRRRAGIQSPSKMTRKLGGYIAQGLAVGISDGKAQVRASVDDAIRDLLSHAKSTLSKAESDLRNYRSNVRGGFTQFADITGVGGDGTYSSATAIKALQARAKQAGQLNKVLASLARGGLNNASLRNLVDEAASGDIGGALAAATSIRKAGTGDIRAINKAVGQIASAGKALSSTAATHFYGGRVSKAEQTLAQIASEIQKSGIAIQLHLTAEQLSQLQRGKQIRADLDAWDRVGGKKKAASK